MLNIKPQRGGLQENRDYLVSPGVETLDRLSSDFFLWEQRPNCKLQLIYIGNAYHSDGHKTLCFATSQDSDVYLVKATSCLKSEEFMAALSDEDKYLVWRWAKAEQKAPDYSKMKLRKC